MYCDRIKKSMDQPGKVANSTSGQLYRGKKSLSMFAVDNFVSRDILVVPSHVSLLIFDIKAESQWICQCAIQTVLEALYQCALLIVNQK